MTVYMPLFRSCKTFRTLTQLHAHLIVSGLHRDPLASTKLIDSYAQTASLDSSTKVFQAFRNPDPFMWGVLMKSYVRNDMSEEAIALYSEMLRLGIHIGSHVFPTVLRAFGGSADVRNGGKLHGRVVKSGVGEDDEVVLTSLVVMYGQLGCSDDARKVFDEMPVRDVVAWSSVIACSESGKLGMFRRMVAEGIEPDPTAILVAVDACGDSGDLRLGKSVHGFVVARSIGTEGWLGNSLVTMYGKFGDLLCAEAVFREIPRPSTASWTAMISCCNQNRQFEEGLRVFEAMKNSKSEPNSVTVAAILRSCAGLGLIREGKVAHCFALRKGLDFDFLNSGLTELYAGFGRIRDCEKVLLGSGERNTVLAWNTLISCYSRYGFFREALLLFKKMQILGLIPDSFSLSSSLAACGSIGQSDLGFQIHCHVIKRGHFDEYVQNSLIDMYCKCGLVEKAYEIFDELGRKSVVAWNCMIGGFSQSGQAVNAIGLFEKMFAEGLDMDEVTFLLAVQACAQLGHFERGKWVHHKIIMRGIENDVFLSTALTDMYAKSGLLRTARRVFDSMPERSIVSWSVMIGGYGFHGEIDRAISLFTEMLESGTRPNGVVFMNILSACSHSGSVEEGKFYFKMMKDLGIEPNTEHFACVVDLLSRAGDLEEAYEIIKSMPVPVDSSIWGSLVNGCRIHQRSELLDGIRSHISSIRTVDPGYYVLLSNIYAEGGNWEEFGKVRSKMNDCGLKKVAGYSSIEF